MKTVLVLEDEPIVTEFLRRALKGFSLIEASTAEQALGLFISHDRQVDLLVAVVTLAVGSGTQVALLLRSAIPNLPVILTSGHPVSHWSDRAFAELERLGSNSLAIVEKPYRAQLLSKVVGDLIGERAPESAKGAGVNGPSSPRQTIRAV
jgi:CheY-like chemotaxis protein